MIFPQNKTLNIFFRDAQTLNNINSETEPRVEFLIL